MKNDGNRPSISYHKLNPPHRVDTPGPAHTPGLVRQPSGRTVEFIVIIAITVAALILVALWR